MNQEITSLLNVGYVAYRQSSRNVRASFDSSETSVNVYISTRPNITEYFSIYVQGVWAISFNCFTLPQWLIVRRPIVDLHLTFANGTHFLTFCYTKFQDPTLSVTTVAFTSEVAAPAMLVYFTVGVKDMLGWPLVAWYSYRTLSVGNVDSWLTRCACLFCLKRGNHKAKESTPQCEHLALNLGWARPQCSLTFHPADSVASA